MTPKSEDFITVDEMRRDLDRMIAEAQARADADPSNEALQKNLARKRDHLQMLEVRAKQVEWRHSPEVVANLGPAIPGTIISVEA